MGAWVKAPPGLAGRKLVVLDKKAFGTLAIAGSSAGPAHATAGKGAVGGVSMLEEAIDGRGGRVAIVTRDLPPKVS